MKRVASFMIADFLALGLAALVGCQTGARTGILTSGESPYAGGNGAFGEDPVAPGAYVSDHPHSTHAGKSAPDDDSPYAGGNGAFGEDPVAPGAYHK